MEKRVDGGGGGGGGGDGHHVYKLPSSFFKYDNVRCYTTDSDTEDEKPNEHDYPSQYSLGTTLATSNSQEVDDRMVQRNQEDSD
ncbi:hypothetical protein Q3G72_009981 [Acer saccharum]|nr:hypothetical protein Q3G72_009981 [Acer saccharum]